MFQSESTTDRNQRPDLKLGASLQLSPGIAYYIRKLLRQNFDRLQFVVAAGAGLKADHLSDLTVVLRSLYCEEAEVKAAILDLERLALSHQALSAQGTLNQQAIASVEQEIFWLLGFKQEQPKHQGKILVVDDTPENLRLLSAALAKQGYDVRSAISGAMALSSVRSIMPDLILLDVRMPGLDGYDVCSQFKADVLTQEIPVIFISAIDDVFDKVKAFKVGAVDFIHKPFQIEEVCARVEHQLSIGRLRQRLEAQNLRLQREMQNRDRVEATLRQERRAAEQLILKMLPRAIASFRSDWQEKGSSLLHAQPIASQFDQATVLQANIVNFSSFAAQTTATEAIARLNTIFAQFDRLVEARNLKTIKTMGDAYLVAGGVPTPTDHLQAIADLAIALRHCAVEAGFQLRIGIATGAVIAGVIRGQRMSYDLWGETVQAAKRLETCAEPNQILVTEATFNKLKERYAFDRQLLQFQGQPLISYCLRERSNSPSP